MIPSLFVPLGSMPLTISGKIDYQSLSRLEHEGALSTDTYVAPGTATEIVMATIWAELLFLDQVGTCDNFFELGGHSLKAIQVISRIREQFLIHVPLRALFENPTVELFSIAVDNLMWIESNFNDQDEDSAEEGEI